MHLRIKPKKGEFIFQNHFITHTHILSITTVDVHLTQAIVRKDKGWGSILSGLVVVLEGLGVVLLYVEGTGHLVAGLSTHRLIFCVVEGMETQVLNFLKILMNDKVEHVT